MLILTTLLLGSCAISSRLERGQIGANVEFAPKNDQLSIVNDKFRVDTTSKSSAPEFVIDNSQFTIDIEEVVVVSTLKVTPERKGKVSVDFVITLPRELQGSCQSVTITPMLHKGDTVEPLEDISIRGGLFTKVQSRNYWQFEQYVKMFRPSALNEQRAFERFVKYPYAEGVRLDSIVESPAALSYFYTQEVSTKGEGNKMLITLEGRVNGLDGSYYQLPSCDTLQYSISSMLTFVDTTTRYVTRVIEKYATINDKNYLSFAKGKHAIVDSLGDNREQLGRIESLMDELINQNEFHVDSIILTASASPEGSFALNQRLARGRALSLGQHLADKFGPRADTLISVRWVAEDWAELSRLIVSSRIKNADKIGSIINSTPEPDKRELLIRTQFPTEYAQIREELYPLLRSVSFKYDLRRVGMLKDTIHTSEVDTLYLRGVELLELRRYSKAFGLLSSYKDHNCALAMMSLGYDQSAYDILSLLAQNYKTLYLRAILCSRLGYIEQGRKCFLEACALNSAMEYRGRLDPEISNLLNPD